MIDSKLIDSWRGKTGVFTTFGWLRQMLIDWHNSICRIGTRLANYLTYLGGDLLGIIGPNVPQHGVLVIIRCPLTRTSLLQTLIVL